MIVAQPVRTISPSQEIADELILEDSFCPVLDAVHYTELSIDDSFCPVIDVEPIDIERGL